MRLLLHRARCSLILGIVTLSTLTLANAAPVSLASPDGRIEVLLETDDAGGPRYTVTFDGATVLARSQLGLVRDDGDFSTNLVEVAPAETHQVEDRYEILTAKRRHNLYKASEAVWHLADLAGRRIDITFRASNDGIAFRYAFPDCDPVLRRITEEKSSFRFAAGTRAWLQPMAVAKSGWEQTNPSYEEYYEKDIPAGTPSPTGAGWVFPALFRVDETWVLLSETGLDRTYCGCRLRSESPDGEYRIGLADPREATPGGPALPESTLPWTTPWRVVVIGSLQTIVESTLGVDLATPTSEPFPKAEAIAPGKAAWSWPLLGDPNTTFDVQKCFVDYAADMGWRYCLVDALWDTQIGYDRIAELADYACTKNVRILVWYNSAGSWNTAPQTPRNLLLTHESRIAEFDRLKAMGVAGLKIDFFGGDGQSMIAYYHDILTDAAPYGFLLNFHGATLPRGWQRTYPHLMTMEAIRGLEFVTFGQDNADKEPSHAAMLPFTRNVFDPMDFTPVVMDRLPRTERRTTSAFELALAVLFTSGIQHYAEIPEGMAKVPDYVRDFMRHVPSIWDDVRFIDGDPGHFVVVARKGDGRWYLAGINADDAVRPLRLDLSRIETHADRVHIITDLEQGGNLAFREETLPLRENRIVDLVLAPRGGFVAVLE